MGLSVGASPRQDADCGPRDSESLWARESPVASSGPKAEAAYDTRFTEPEALTDSERTTMERTHASAPTKNE